MSAVCLNLLLTIAQFYNIHLMIINDPLMERENVDIPKTACPRSWVYFFELLYWGQQGVEEDPKLERQMTWRNKNFYVAAMFEQWEKHTFFTDQIMQRLNA